MNLVEVSTFFSFIQCVCIIDNNCIRYLFQVSNWDSSKRQQYKLLHYDSDSKRYIFTVFNTRQSSQESLTIFTTFTRSYKIFSRKFHRSLVKKVKERGERFEVQQIWRNFFCFLFFFLFGLQYQQLLWLMKLPLIDWYNWLHLWNTCTRRQRKHAVSVIT